MLLLVVVIVTIYTANEGMRETVFDGKAGFGTTVITRFYFCGCIPTATVCLLGNDLFFEAPFATCAHHHRLADSECSGVGCLVHLLATANSTSPFRFGWIASFATCGLYDATCDDDRAAATAAAQIGTSTDAGCFIASSGTDIATRNTDGSTLTATLAAANASTTGFIESDGRFVAESFNVTTHNIHFTIKASILAATYSGSKTTAIGLNGAAIDVDIATISFISSTDAGTAATAKHFITVGVEFT